MNEYPLELYGIFAILFLSGLMGSLSYMAQYVKGFSQRFKKGKNKNKDKGDLISKTDE